ncbi:osmotically inducible protein OsmC [Sphingobium sp. B11D3B]|uniref:OsmC family protein n=1 Tax=Sphingobium sp. B11D3B TaxID=2940575 RepID=UPI0022264183|nr:OsmC family protein [Sphingobium sp. B11D3B]MCW2387269.1 osmotically inducible protein OsmC [Sphingobium sp. B11D3B]
MTTRTASAQYEGMGKAGKGRLTTQSGVLKEQPYGFGTRFGDEPGTNPEELIAAAHAGCFTMALSFALERAGYADGSLDTKASVKLEQGDGGFTITRSDLVVEATVPGIDPDEFARIAEEAKKTCPVSKLLNAEVTLEHRLS